MSNSSLIDYVKISPNSNNPRKDTIKKITIHHMAGNLSVEACGNIFASSSRQASSNYGIDSDGRVGMYVEEKNRSWCSSSPSNDHQAVTIEVANDEIGGQWHVSDKALSKLIDLCVDICKRNGIEKLNFTGDTSGNLTMHKWFANTTCPGPYLESKFPYIAEEVNKRLQPEPQPTPDKIDVKYQAYANGRWWANITNYNETDAMGYAGVIGKPMSGLRGNTVGTVEHAGHLQYRVHQKGGGWLNWITDRQKIKNGDDFAGNLGKPIDGVQIKCTKGTAVYRVHLKGGNWLNWISKVDDTAMGYAGIYGKEIDAIQIYIK